MVKVRVRLVTCMGTKACKSYRIFSFSFSESRTFPVRGRFMCRATKNTVRTV